MNIRETNLQFTGLKKRQRTTHIIIHHTAGFDMSAEQMHKMHIEQNNWSGIAYHFLIRPDGNIERGRPADMQGAHAGPDWNPISEGIALIGNFDNHHPTPPQVVSLDWLVRDRMAANNIMDPAKILGHNETGRATACPGQFMHMDALRRRMGDVLRHTPEPFSFAVLADKLEEIARAIRERETPTI